MRSAPRSAVRPMAVIAAVTVLVALVVVVFAAGDRAGATGRGTAIATSLRADEAGHRAARLLLHELGIAAHSRRGARLPDGSGHVLVRVTGLPGATDAWADVPERERATLESDLLAWVRRGNGLLLLSGAAPTVGDLPEVSGTDDAAPTAPSWDYDSLTTAAPGLDGLFGARPKPPFNGLHLHELHELPGLDDPWFSTTYSVSGFSDARTLVRRPDAIGGDAVVVEVDRGEGRVTVVAEPWFATNVGLSRRDNAAWFVTLVERLRGGGDVWFDDRSLGEVGTRGVLSLLTERGLGPALAAVLCLLLVLWWHVGVSDAPDRRVADRATYRPEAYADLRADLYAKCMNGADVRRVVAHEISRRLGRGDTTTPERALRLLAVRAPERAEAVRVAVGALPDPAETSVAKHPRTWAIAVGDVWRALGVTETTDEEKQS